MADVRISKPVFLIMTIICILYAISFSSTGSITGGDKNFGVFLNSNNQEIQEIPVCQSQASPRNHFDIEDSKMFTTSENNKSYIKIETTSFDFELSNPVSRTGSMNPSIVNGAKVITRKPKDINDLFIGDIVCFKNPNKNDPKIHYQICHRIIEIEGDRILTKGDNNQYTDNWIYKNDVEDIIIGVLY